MKNLKVVSRIALFMCLFLLYYVKLNAQTTGKVNNADIKKTKKENMKAAKRAAKYGRERHLSIQSKKTKKMMKKHLKDANRRHKGMSR